MANAMEPLLSAFGVRGSLANVENRNKPLPPFTESGIFEISGDQVNSNHPIVNGLTREETIKKVYFFYGEAYQSSGNEVLWAGKNSNLKDKVGELNNFPAVVVALSVGKGRVVALGDATMFTSKFDDTLKENTGINRLGSDNIQLALNVFRWLGKKLN